MAKAARMRAAGLLAAVSMAPTRGGALHRVTLAAFEHQRRHGVAEQMARSAFADAGLLDVFADDQAETVAAERFALRGEENGHVVRFGNQPGTRFIQVFSIHRTAAFGHALWPNTTGALADRDHTIFAPFPSGLAVHVVKLQVH